MIISNTYWITMAHEHWPLIDIKSWTNFNLASGWATLIFNRDILQQQTNKGNPSNQNNSVSCSQNVKALFDCEWLRPFFRAGMPNRVTKFIINPPMAANVVTPLLHAHQALNSTSVCNATACSRNSTQTLTPCWSDRIITYIREPHDTSWAIPISITTNSHLIPKQPGWRWLYITRMWVLISLCKPCQG